MRLTKRQLNEIAVCIFFIPRWAIKKYAINKKHIMEFFDWSENGVRPDVNNPLVWGKYWRDRHLSMYVDDFDNGILMKEDIDRFPPKIKEWLIKKLA